MPSYRTPGRSGNHPPKRAAPRTHSFQLRKPPFPSRTAPVRGSHNKRLDASTIFVHPAEGVCLGGIMLQFMPCALVSGLAFAQELPSEEAVSADDLAWAQEALLGLERIYRTETEWSFALTVDTAKTQVTGSLTWRYDGQQQFSDARAPTDRFVTYTQPEFVLTGIESYPDLYLDFVHVDGLGRRWVVDSVDLDLAEAEILELDSESLFDVGDDGIPGIEFSKSAGEVLDLELTGWTITQCNGANAFFKEDASSAVAPLSTTR